MAKRLFKTTIVIWTEGDPTGKMELEDLAREATEGSGYCSKMKAIKVANPAGDPDWDGTEFFGEVV
jgi:hypothetical protein